MIKIDNIIVDPYEICSVNIEHKDSNKKGDTLCIIYKNGIVKYYEIAPLYKESEFINSIFEKLQKVKNTNFSY